MATELVTFKIEKSFLKEIDDTVKRSKYHNRTEFIRDAIRRRLTEHEKEEAIRKLEAGFGSMKGKFKYTDKEAREMAWKDVEKKYGLKSD